MKIPCHRHIAWVVHEQNQLWEAKTHRTFAKPSVIIAIHTIERVCCAVKFRSTWHVSLALIQCSHKMMIASYSSSFFSFLLFPCSPSPSLDPAMCVCVCCVFNDIYAPNGNRKLYLYLNGKLIGTPPHLPYRWVAVCVCSLVRAMRASNSVNRNVQIDWRIESSLCITIEIMNVGPYRQFCSINSWKWHLRIPIGLISTVDAASNEHRCNHTKLQMS